MIERAVEQPGDRGEADMRVGADVDALAGGHLGGAEMVEKHERADIPALREGQQPAHAEPAEIALAGLNDQFDRVGHPEPLASLRMSMDECAGRGKLGG